MARLVGLLLLLVVCSGTPGAGQRGKPNAPLPSIAPLDLPRALESYADGRFDEAVQSVARAGDDVGRNLRRHWSVTAQQWIDAQPSQRPQRILVAASLALETEHLRAERGDWRATGDPPCGAACVLDWAQLQLVERGAPDRAERAWYLAAAALAGGVRDWRYLQRTIDPARRTRLLPGLMDRALVRFPGDPSLRLEQALGAAGRYNVTVDGGRLAASVVPSLPFGPSRTELVTMMQIQLGTPDTAVNLLASLAEDPDAGPEARLRLGYLQWALGHDAVAKQHVTAAATQARDADLRYLAQFLLGWIAIAAGDSAGAIPWLEAALATRPGSQSASIALASLELQRGNADKAHDIANASLADRRADADPWRLFLYGHHPHWPARRAELRREVKPREVKQ